MHLCSPARVGVLEVALDLASRQLHGVEVVGEGAELEQVTHVDLARRQHGTRLERGGEGDLRLHGLQLHAVDDVHVGRGAEEGIDATYLGLQRTDFAGEVVLDGALLTGEGLEEGRVWGYPLEGDEAGAELLGDDLVPLLAHGDLDVGDAVEVVGRVDQEDGVAATALGAEPGQLLAVVVPDEQEVDAWDTFAEGAACVLEVVGIVILQA